MLTGRQLIMIGPASFAAVVLFQMLEIPGLAGIAGIALVFSSLSVPIGIFYDRRNAKRWWAWAIPGMFLSPLVGICYLTLVTKKQ